MKPKFIIYLIGLVFIGLFVLGFFVFSPTVAMRRQRIDAFLVEFKDAQDYTIDIAYDIDRNNRHWLSDYQIQVSERMNYWFRTNAIDDGSYRLVERIGDQWIGYRDMGIRYLNPEPLDREDVDLIMAEYVKERPDRVIETLPWDRAEVFSVTRLRFTLTIEEFLDCPWFAKAVEIEDIDENTVMPAAFRAVVDLEIDKADGHLIVSAIASDLNNQRWSYECGDTGISDSGCKHSVRPTMVQSVWHYRLAPELGTVESKFQGYKVLPAGNPTLIRANSLVDVEYVKPSILFRVCYQRFWFEAGQVELALEGQLYNSSLVDTTGTMIPQVHGAYTIPTAGYYIFAYQSGDEVKFTFHQVD
jgi:hypothetical protein